MRTPFSTIVVVRLLASVFGVLFLFFFATAPTAQADTFQLQFTFNNFNGQHYVHPARRSRFRLNHFR